jgi:serine/threonine protein kinase
VGGKFEGGVGLQVYVTDDHLAIVMEYASGGTLAQRINEAGPMSEESAKLLFVQLLAGMKYCHSLG